MGYRVINGQLFPVDKILNNSYNENIKSSPKKTDLDFEKILDKSINKNENFSISNHAAARIKERNINFNEVDMKKINDGINKADEKGAKDCLILYKDVALVASIKNRTIITAVDKENSKDNVFTNIDSVVLL